MQLRHPVVVPLKEGKEVLRQIALVFRIQTAHDAEIHGDVSAVIGHEDVAGMHVGVKEVVLERLGEEDLHPPFRKPLQFDAGRLDGLDIGNGDPGDTFHHQDVAPDVWPVNLGDVDQRRVFEIAPQQGSVGSFPQHVQLIEDGFFVLLHHLHRSQPFPLRPVALHHAGQDIHQLQVPADDLFDVGADHLDHHLAAVVEGGSMDLGYGGRGEGGFLETPKYLGNGLAVCLFDDLPRLFAGEGRDVVLQPGELHGDIVRQQVPAGGEDLAELDEDGAQLFQGLPDPHRARGVPIP